MSQIVLLGAGASVDAGVPDTYQMTEQITNEFFADFQGHEQARVIAFALGGLLFQEGVKGRNPYGGVNVEELFTAIQLLADRRNLEVAPFVGSWHPTISELDRVASRSRPSDKLLKTIIAATSSALGARTGASGFSTSDFEGALKDAVEAIVPGAGEGRIYELTAQSMLRSLTRIIWINDATRVGYLAPILRAIEKDGRSIIATLNYDNSIECLASTRGHPCDTGLEAWSQRGEFDFSSDGLHLLKLHGSIDWAFERYRGSVDKPMPWTDLKKVPAEQVGRVWYEPAVIFGHRNKLTAEGPFLGLLMSFQRELSKAQLLTIVGYSFRDPHINECISKWLSQSGDRRIRIVDPEFHSSREEYAMGLRYSPRVEVIDQRANVALESLF